MSHKNRKRRFFFPSKPRRLQTVTILPSLVTLINGICGFAAIGLAAHGPDKFALAGYMIFIAMIADMLDGRIARMSQTTSSFGGQLDSLCDMLSFGAAPAVLAFRVLIQNFPDLFGEETFFLSDFFRRFLWLAGASYMCCAAVRLARFNVENVEDESAHRVFQGLPTPAAAGILAGLIVLIEHMKADPTARGPLFALLLKTILYCLPLIAIGAGALMVSRIEYPHLVNQYLRGKKPIIHLFWVAVILALIWQTGLQVALVVCFGGYALTGLWRRIWQHSRRVIAAPAESPAPAAPDHV
ncbi:MAG: phosphatidylcholine/phosphatidylserine synthase [Anaerohalosphaeraceae bacterium]